MKLFKENKKQPIKFRNFKYIGEAKYHPNICYYYKELPNDNFYIMTCSLEGTYKHPEIGAGTNVKVIDTFMANYLYNLRNDINTLDTNDFITKAVETSFSESKDIIKKNMIKQYNSSIPKEIKDFDSWKKAIQDDFEVLYCSNDESPDRKFGVIKIVMVKEIEIKGNDDLFADIHENITLFQCLEYRVNSKYIKGLSKTKYIESLTERVQVAHDLLN